MKYVYILQSLDGDHYTGITDDLIARLAKHNSGEVSHTSKLRPWRIATYIALIDEQRAITFERYLKSSEAHRTDIVVRSDPQIVEHVFCYRRKQ